MIVYYDLLSGKEIGTDAYASTTPSVGIIAIESKRITIEEKEVNIGANASKEGGEEDESVDASEAKTVINIVYASHLQKIDLDKKEYKTLIGDYFKKVLKALVALKWKALGVKEDDIPEDKEEAKAKESEAAAELSKYEKPGYEATLAKIEAYKKNFNAIQKFVTETILGKFSEYEFYTPEEAELGSSIIIPARYVGEATAPIFYFFEDGIRQKKE